MPDLDLKVKLNCYILFEGYLDLWCTSIHSISSKKLYFFLFVFINRKSFFPLSSLSSLEERDLTSTFREGRVCDWNHTHQYFLFLVAPLIGSKNGHTAEYSLFRQKTFIKWEIFFHWFYIWKEISRMADSFFHTIHSLISKYRWKSVEKWEHFVYLRNRLCKACITSEILNYVIQ